MYVSAGVFYVQIYMQLQLHEQSILYILKM